MPLDQIQKPLTFTTPDGLQTIHATHLVVNPLPGRYLLSFFEVLPPIILGNTDDERRREWDKITTITAPCVARLLVAEADLGAFIQVLQQQQAQMKQQTHGDFKAFA